MTSPAHRMKIKVVSASATRAEQVAQLIRETGGALVLCGMGDQVRRVFELAGYIQHFTVTATRPEAIAHARG